jgi:hypothetical protein
MQGFFLRLVEQFPAFQFWHSWLFAAILAISFND